MGLVGVDPVEGGAAGIVPGLVFVFFGEQLEGVVAGIAELDGSDAGAGLDERVSEMGRGGGLSRSLLFFGEVARRDTESWKKG